MNLHGSLAKLKKSGARAYVFLSQRFSENLLIQETFLAMARDQDQQAASLHALPRAFWNQLKEDGQEPLKSIQQYLTIKAFEIPEDVSIRQCFSLIMDYEQPAILRVDAPLIRCLRSQGTDRSLDFYITVKSHVARFDRMIRAFSGDPILLQRSAALMQDFEREVQLPDVPVEYSRPSKRSPSRVGASARENAEKIRASSLRAKRSAQRHAAGKHSKSVPDRAKSMVKKIDMPRRRARR
jgi:hypothetical protein